MLNRLKKRFYDFIPHNNGLVLMYHRIHTPATDPWQLAVSPANFEEHLKVLKRAYQLISVNEFLDCMHRNTLKKNSVCITLDDGYADNYEHARPLLLAYDCPATFFIPSALIEKNELFWWDELEQTILAAPKLPASLTLKFPNELFSCTIDQQTITEAEWIRIKGWTYPQPPLQPRCALYLALWQRLKPLPYAEIQCVLQQLRGWSGYNPPEDPASFPMTGVQLQCLFDHSLFSPGIHTASHPALALQSPEVQEQEIRTCADYLKQYTREKLLPIAYPYGSYNKDTLSIVANLNVMAGFTTSPSLVHAGSNSLALGRFQVRDCGGAEFQAQLEAWFATKS
jgi:peptidoglycan/xylan/chitin deacetylase (PgdA/CDA1 family)